MHHREQQQQLGESGSELGPEVEGRGEHGRRSPGGEAGAEGFD